MNRRRMIGSTLSAMAAIAAGCSTDLTEPERQPELQTVWQALEKAGRRPAGRPNVANDAFVYSLDGQTPPPGWGWRIEVDGLLFQVSAKEMRVRPGQSIRCYLHNE